MDHETPHDRQADSDIFVTRTETNINYLTDEIAALYKHVTNARSGRQKAVNADLFRRIGNLQLVRSFLRTLIEDR